MPITSLHIFNHIVRLTRNIPISVLLEDFNTQNTLMRLINNRRDPHLTNPDIAFTLQAEQFKIHSMTPDRYDITRFGDILVGVHFPDIKENQTVILKHGFQILDNFVPKKDKVYITLQDLVPLNAIEFPFSDFNYQIINNTDNTVDTTQTVYGIYAFFDSHMRDILCRGISIKVKNITYDNYTGILHLSIAESISFDKYSMSGYKINHSLNILQRFFTYVQETQIKMRKEHQTQWYYVMAELECMPDFGSEAINAVDRLNTIKQLTLLKASFPT